ncbi:ABC transporter permease [Endothiovibrio diazotrophicus]
MLGFFRKYLVNSVGGLVGPSRALATHRALITMLVRREMTGQTSGTLFGTLWMLLQPALQVVGFWFLLDVVLRVKLPGKAPFLDYFLVGMLPWLLLSEVMQRSLLVLDSMSALYRRTPFPLEILPLVPLLLAGSIYGVIYAGTVGFLVGVAALPAALLVVLVLLIWLIPLSYLLAVVGLFLRDVRQLFPFVLTIILYLTPILYSPQVLSESARWLLAFNPFADLMALIHGAVQGAPWGEGQLLRPLIYWLLLLAPAWVLYRRAMPHMREAL